VFASALGALLFGESPDLWTAIGGALVLLGAWLAGTQR
jgi:drug/metabolite transporter (DMT)-like permease